MTQFRAFFIGVILSSLSWLYAFEWIHLTIEAEGHKDFCGQVEREVQRITGRYMDTTHSIKIAYKWLTRPVKELYITFDPEHHDEFAVIEDGKVISGVFKSPYRDSRMSQ